MTRRASNPGRTPLGLAVVCLSVVCLSLWLATGWVGEARAAADPTLSEALEYQVKAAFLYNFLKFIEAPPAAPLAGASPSRDGPIVIGVVGNPAFADVLEETVRGKTVNGRPVNVVRFSKLAEVRGCQEVFFAAPAPASVNVLPGVLTVGEEPRFLRNGGILNFYLEDNKVRFEISTEGAKASGLYVNAQLLKLGRAR